MSFYATSRRLGVDAACLSLTSVVWPLPVLIEAGILGLNLNEHHLNPYRAHVQTAVRVTTAYKMMQSALDTFLRKFVTVGRLTVRWPDGRTQIYAGRPGPEAGVMLRDRRTVWRLMLNPKLSVGEAYMDGGLVSLGGSIHDVLEVVLANLRTNRKGPFVAWLRRAAVRVWRPINQFNARARARRNVAHHYDLNGRLYSLFLDRDRQYSCAYFPKGTETLEEAQEAKKHHIAAKLCLDRPVCRYSISAAAGAAWR